MKSFLYVTTALFIFTSQCSEKDTKQKASVIISDISNTYNPEYERETSPHFNKKARSFGDVEEALSNNYEK